MKQPRRCSNCNKVLRKKSQKWYCSESCATTHRGWLRDPRSGHGKAPTSKPSARKSEFHIKYESTLKATSDALARTEAQKPKIIVIRDGQKSKALAESKKKRVAHAARLAKLKKMGGRKNSN